MTNSEILSHVDHTLLRATARWSELEKLCDEAIRWGTASVCVPPCTVPEIRAHYGEKLTICTVIGFPLGYNTTAVKAAEAREAIENGADEVDMVINQGWVKDWRYGDIIAEISAVRAAVGGAVLKVIFEVCNLGESEIVALCRCASEAGADFIKTSTGFAAGGATPEAVKLMAEHAAPGVKVKAAGGIRSREDMEMYLELGCERLGTSSAVGILTGGGGAGAY